MKRVFLFSVRIFLDLMLVSGVVFLPMVSCSSDDSENVDPDPRTSLVGVYQTGDYHVHVISGTVDTTYTVATNPELVFLLDSGLNPDELRIHPGDFIEKTVKGVFFQWALVSVDIQDPDGLVLKKTTSAFEYEIGDVLFDLTISDGTHTAVYPHTFDAHISFDNNSATVSYHMESHSATIADLIYDGTVTGDKR